MSYYRIRSVETPPSMQGEENLEPFYLEDYTGELKKCKVNPMFSRMNQILLYLYSLVLDASVSVTLHICYHQHELWYIIGVPNTTGYDLPENIYGCRLEEVTDASFLENTYERTEKFTGGIDPQYLDQRKENILDNFIRLCPDEDFMISTTLGKPADDEQSGRIQKLEKKITYWNKEANKQVSRQGIPFVGKTKSYQETEIVSESIVKNYRHEYYALRRSCCQRPTIVISGNAYVCESFRWLIKSVRKTIIKYNQNMWLQPLEENREDDAPILPVDYLATLWAFPVNPASGLALIQTVPFGVLDKPLQSGIQLGCLVQGTRTSLPVQIEKNDLTMHAFVTGVTGAGKTSTVKELIGQAFNQKVPSLVLEPAKREYAGFFQKLTTTSRICKLGLPTESFHINPFAFPQGVHIQTHIDHIKSVFIAAFPMYGPMPYIFETALYSIYRQYGWDFITGECRGTRRFPTLDDLYLAVDDATTRVGYSDDLQNDVRGALKVRIQSLMAGAKGHILNREDSTEMSELLAYPTVVELEHIGDPQEKVFIMGLLLMGLYEHYLSDPGKYNSPLRHLLVIEEAHRLLENVQANNNPEIADMKGKSLETFNNILLKTHGLLPDRWAYRAFKIGIPFLFWSKIPIIPRMSHRLQ